MNQPTVPNRDVEQACLLLQAYSFELGGYRPAELLAIWQEQLEAEPSWIRSAVVEALYQGRYKALSVEQILRLWKRRGHPLRHFNQDFEQVVIVPVGPTTSKYTSLTTPPPAALFSPKKVTLSTTETSAIDSDLDEHSEPEVTTATDSAALLALPEHTSNAIAENPEDPEPKVAEVIETVTNSSSQTQLPESETLQTQEISTHADALTPVDKHLSGPENTPIEVNTFIQLGLTSSASQPMPPTQQLCFNHPEPIRKFIPQSEAPEFYLRLQSVARRPC